MKTTNRRNLAALSFIALLAVVYVIILLVGKNSGVGASGPEVTETIESDKGKTGDVRTDATEKKSNSEKTKSRSEGKDTQKKKKKSKRTPKPYPKDKEDVFDRPIPPAIKN